MGNTKEYPENVCNAVQSVTRHHTCLQTYNTSNNPQPQKSTKRKTNDKKRHNTQRSPNLGTQKQLQHEQLRTTRKDATDALVGGIAQVGMGAAMGGFGAGGLNVGKLFG